MQTHATENGRIVIPAVLRKQYGIRKGTRIIVADSGHSIVLRPMTEQYLQRLQGSLKGKGGLEVLVYERTGTTSDDFESDPL